MARTRADRPGSATGGAALIRAAALLGLRRVVIDTIAGPVVVRTGRETGGPATILLHGAAGSWTTWTPLLAESDLEERPLRDVIAFDLPGWGESPLPDRADPDVGLLSTAVAEAARALGYESWNVLGHSLGGFVALDLAVAEPTATLSVGLVSGTGAGEIDAITRPIRGGLRLPWFSGMLVAMRVLRLLGPAGTGLVRLLHRVGALTPLASPLFVDPRSVDPTVIEALAVEVRPKSFVLAARAAARYDQQRWRSIGCRVRSVRGERDVFVGEHDSDTFAALIPDFHETLLHGAGHFAAIERPGAVLAELVV
ncbi:alpha/beta fold hydrolase [Amnibacterium flavum]|uniref:alpha/beta fold hydrolase n=1 Tax=Amnibacterium flavum TaxID=2173173 RepID=UPI001F0C6BB5|nr:alpha/beta hydrolase [Amnibacterium flavum]